MGDIHDEHGDHYHCSIEDCEVDLSLNDAARPAISQFCCSVDSTDEQKSSAGKKPDEQPFDVEVYGLAPNTFSRSEMGPVVFVAVEELNSAEREDREGYQL